MHQYEVCFQHYFKEIIIFFYDHKSVSRLWFTTMFSTKTHNSVLHYDFHPLSDPQNSSCFSSHKWKPLCKAYITLHVGARNNTFPDLTILLFLLLNTDNKIFCCCENQSIHSTSSSLYQFDWVGRVTEHRINISNVQMCWKFEYIKHFI